MPSAVAPLMPTVDLAVESRSTRCARTTVTGCAAMYPGKKPIVVVPMVSAPGSIVVELDAPESLVIGSAIPNAMDVWRKARPRHASPVTRSRRSSGRPARACCVSCTAS